MADPPLTIYDDGVRLGPVFKLDFAGSGVTATKSGITGTITVTGGGSIPQVDSDPASPTSEDVWVLKGGSGSTGGGVVKAFLGLGFPMLTVGSGGSTTYQLSYKTHEGAIVRTTLS